MSRRFTVRAATDGWDVIDAHTGLVAGFNHERSAHKAAAMLAKQPEKADWFHWLPRNLSGAAVRPDHGAQGSRIFQAVSAVFLYLMLLGVLGALVGMFIPGQLVYVSLVWLLVTGTIWLALSLHNLERNRS